jgi:hypothetical protein
MAIQSAQAATDKTFKEADDYVDKPHVTTTGSVVRKKEHDLF